MSAKREGGRVRFRAELLLVGKTATGIEIPEKVVTALGAGKRPQVRVTIKDHTYRSTVAVMGGRYMVGVSAENREKAGVAAGDKVDVDLELDMEPRKVEVPPDLARALKAEPAAKRTFEALSYSHKRRHVLAIEGAKAAETRARRIAKAIEMLRDGGK